MELTFSNYGFMYNGERRQIEGEATFHALDRDVAVVIADGLMEASVSLAGAEVAYGQWPMPEGKSLVQNTTWMELKVHEILAPIA